MKDKKRNKKKGFTLIEILVAVLIIGILSAIALPKYRVAVEKAHVSQVVSAIASIAEAQEVFYLANGRYTDSLSDLDITMPATINGWTFTLYNDSEYKKVEAKHSSNNDIGLVHYYKNPGTIDYLHPGQTYCFARKGKTFAEKVCKSLATKKGFANSYGTRWII
ncbi:MAG: prepilin-type N-terminal cleavage/methylation domain-containing protein [Elusimicrobiaceae bacterium]|nr:prepilin-type N-terminal cleavage/methylation domain-containing protein [Elusimicrobiaceae bacterium]